jgi:hypothetical protein
MRHPDPSCPQDPTSLEFASRKGSVAWVSVPEPIKAAVRSAWGSVRLESSPATVLGIVYAANEESALAVMIVKHNVRPIDQKWLFACPR